MPYLSNIYFQQSSKLGFWIPNGSKIHRIQKMNFYPTKKHSCRQMMGALLLAEIDHFCAGRLNSAHNRKECLSIFLSTDRLEIIQIGKKIFDSIILLTVLKKSTESGLTIQTLYWVFPTGRLQKLFYCTSLMWAFMWAQLLFLFFLFVPEMSDKESLPFKWSSKCACRAPVEAVAQWHSEHCTSPSKMKWETSFKKNHLKVSLPWCASVMWMCVIYMGERKPLLDPPPSLITQSQIGWIFKSKAN